MGGVPLSHLSVKKFGGEGNQGVSGASFFKCTASFDGPVVNPTFGLPTGYFLKMRNAAQDVNEFTIEGTVDKLTDGCISREEKEGEVTGMRDVVLSATAVWGATKKRGGEMRFMQM